MNAKTMGSARDAKRGKVGMRAEAAGNEGKLGDKNMEMVSSSKFRHQYGRAPRPAAAGERRAQFHLPAMPPTL
jgi:hypothetical protein